MLKKESEKQARLKSAFCHCPLIEKALDVSIRKNIHKMSYDNHLIIMKVEVLPLKKST
jgi:hypothetical protein